MWGQRPSKERGKFGFLNYAAFLSASYLCWSLLPYSTGVLISIDHIFKCNVKTNQRMWVAGNYVCPPGLSSLMSSFTRMQTFPHTKCTICKVQSSLSIDCTAWTDCLPDIPLLAFETHHTAHRHHILIFSQLRQHLYQPDLCSFCSG